MGAGQSRGQPLRKIHRRRRREARTPSRRPPGTDRAANRLASGAVPVRRVRVGKFGDRKRGFDRRDDRRANAGTPRTARAVAGNRRHLFAGRKRRRIARAPDQDDRAGVSAVPDCAARSAKAGTLCRPAGGEEKARRRRRAAAVCLRARRHAVVERGRGGGARPEKSFRHVLPGRAHGHRAAQGHLHVCRAMRHERRDSRPAEPSRLPEPAAQIARRAVRPDAVRRVQGARENREGRGRRQKMGRGAKFQDRIHRA